jgi:hypothetical protein
MKYKIIVLLFLFVSIKVFSQDAFFCVDGPLRIRNEPNLNSRQIGSLNLFDMVNIIERTSNKSTIDGIEDYWYKIRFNNIEGYVFGGYGVIIKEKYEVNTIDDFINILPLNFQTEELGRYIFTWPADHVPMVRLDYSVTFMNHSFNLHIYFRPNSQIEINNVSNRYNLEIRNANNQFGRGDSYKILNELNRPYVSELTTFYGNQGRYFFQNWASGTTYDIANFLFETNFDNIFNGIIISPFNLWLNSRDLETINRLTTVTVNNARTNRIKESMLYHIFYEIILRLKIN